MVRPLMYPRARVRRRTLPPTSGPDERYWRARARAWSTGSPPWRPSAADLAAYAQALGPRPGRVLILGATPELASLPWPATTTFTVADRCRAVARAPWAFPALRHADVSVTDWRRLPFPARSFDLVLADGISGVLPRRDARRVSAEIGRVLARDGRLVTRLFLGEAAVAADAGAARYTLAARLAGRGGFVSRREVWRAAHSEATGDPVLRAWRHEPLRLWFLSRSAATAWLAPHLRLAAALPPGPTPVACYGP